MWCAYVTSEHFRKRFGRFFWFVKINGGFYEIVNDVGILLKSCLSEMDILVVRALYIHWFAWTVSLYHNLSHQPYFSVLDFRRLDFPRMFLYLQESFWFSGIHGPSGHHKNPTLKCRSDVINEPGSAVSVDYHIPHCTYIRNNAHNTLTFGLCIDLWSPDL